MVGANLSLCSTQWVHACSCLSSARYARSLARAGKASGGSGVQSPRRSDTSPDAAPSCLIPLRELSQVYGELSRDEEAVASAERALSIIKVRAARSRLRTLCGICRHFWASSARHTPVILQTTDSVSWWPCYQIFLSYAVMSLMTAECTCRSSNTLLSVKLPTISGSAAQGLSGVLSYEHIEPFYKRAAAAKDQAGDREGAHELRKRMLHHKQRR